MVSWLLCLRFLIGITLGLVGMVLAVLGFVASIGFVTRKSILTTYFYIALSGVSLMMAIIVFDPTKASGALIGILCVLAAAGLSTGIHLFNLSLLEKGWRKMFTLLRRLLKCLLSFRNSSR